MAHVYIDREDDGRIRVTVVTGARFKVTRFDDRAAADHFANSKIGRGFAVSTLDMTPEQLAAHKEREARAAALLAREFPR